MDFWVRLIRLGPSSRSVIDLTTAPSQALNPSEPWFPNQQNVSGTYTPALEFMDALEGTDGEDTFPDHRMIPFPTAVQDTRVQLAKMPRKAKILLRGRGGWQGQGRLRCFLRAGERALRRTGSYEPPGR